MAGNSSRLLPSQWQRLPAHCWLIQQVPLPLSHLIKISPIPYPKTWWHHSTLWSPSILYTDNGSPFTVEEFKRFPQRQSINHIISYPHFHQMNTAQDAKTSLQTLLLALQSTPRARSMPSCRTILHNHTIQQPGRPLMPVDMEMVWNYLNAKKHIAKKKYQQGP